MKLVIKHLPNGKYIGIITWHKQVWYQSDEYSTSNAAKEDTMHFGKEIAHWWN